MNTIFKTITTLFVIEHGFTCELVWIYAVRPRGTHPVVKTGKHAYRPHFHTYTDALNSKNIEFSKI